MTKPTRPLETRSPRALAQSAPAPFRPRAVQALGVCSFFWIGAAASLLAGCSSDVPVLSIDIVTGHEKDTFTQAPAVTRVDIVGRTLGGAVAHSASAAPGGAFDFGEVRSEEVLTFEATGVDASGSVVVEGRSLSGIPLSAVAGGVIPVFAQRVNQWARPPGGLARAHLGAPVAVLGERFLMTTGGSSAAGAEGSADPKTSDFYDLFGYGGGEGLTMPRAARSMVARIGAVLLIDEAGASWVDFDINAYEDMALPAGLGSFADVAGGQTIESSEGRSFVIGATRRGGEKTAAILEIKFDGALAALELEHPRSGAAAVWLEGTGLVVAGGSADAPGIEVLAPGTTGFVVREFPFDAAEGAGAVVVDSARIALVGGVLAGAPAPTRFITPGCTQMCAAEEAAEATLPVALSDVRAFALGGGRVVAVGSEVGSEVAGPGLTRTFLVGLAAPSVEEAPLRDPRSNASVVAAPNGTLSILGGSLADGSPALTVEMFFPK